MKEKRLQLVELNHKIKQAKKLFDELKLELMPEIGLEAISVGDYLITKYNKVTPALDSNADVEKLMKAYPQYLKFDVAKFARENKATAAAYIDETITEVIAIKKRKT